LFSEGGEGVGTGGAGASSACATPMAEPINANEPTREPTAKRRKQFGVVILFLLNSGGRTPDLSHLIPRFNLG
jgi:hypothetical protein